VSFALLTKAFTVVDRRFFFVALHTSAVLDLGIELRVHANPHPDSVTITPVETLCHGCDASSTLRQQRQAN
jgi:hypothetical protein